MTHSELSQQQLDELQQDLQDKKARLSQSLSAAKGATETVELDQTLMGRVSRVDALQQQAMAIATYQQQQQELQQVVRALAKFDEDEYGYCESCDEVIPFNRLKIKPESLYCIQCQSQMETDSS